MEKQCDECMVQRRMEALLKRADLWLQLWHVIPIISPPSRASYQQPLAARFSSAS